MILIGQYDSPFVRRVAIALALYGLEYEHRPWSVWADADELAKINPLRRVPTLILDDGDALFESGAILDAIDEIADRPGPHLPRSGARRRWAMRTCALATGLADKAVSLFYETLLHEAASQVWIDRCRAQIADVLDALENERRHIATDYWYGQTINHADIAVACALRFAREAHPGLFDAARWPSLQAHAQRCDALEVFQTICQPLTVAMKDD